MPRPTARHTRRTSSAPAPSSKSSKQQHSTWNVAVLVYILWFRRACIRQAKQVKYRLQKSARVMAATHVYRAAVCTHKLPNTHNAAAHIAPHARDVVHSLVAARRRCNRIARALRRICSNAYEEKDRRTLANALQMTRGAEAPPQTAHTTATTVASRTTTIYYRYSAPMV